MYAASNGLLPEDTITSDLVSAIKIEAARPTPGDILTFWVAYARLARLVRPVTAESLAASSKYSLVRMQCKAGALVAAVIVASILLFISNTTLNETSELIARQNTAALKLWSDAQTLHTDQTEEKALSSDPSSPNAMNNARVFEELIEFSRGSATLLQSAGRLQRFTPWLNPAPGTLTVALLNVQPDLVTNGSKIEEQVVSQIKLYQNIRNYALDLSKIVTLFYSSFSTYVLPTVYALLGAFLYGFRYISAAVERKEYLPTVASGARYSIASIGGLVVGLFGSSWPQTATLTPLTIAFLIGYAVDAFFARLDQVIEKLKGTGASDK